MIYQKIKVIENILCFVRIVQTLLCRCLEGVSMMFFLFAFILGSSYSVTEGLTHDTNIKVTLKLELEGSLPSCERIVAGDQERSIDCHDAFFNDGPFLDRHTINFTVPQEAPNNIQNYNVCLYGISEEKALACSNVAEEKINIHTREIIFSFTDDGIKTETRSATANTQNGSEFTLNIIFMKEEDKPCTDIDVYINHPILVDNKTHFNCKLAYSNNTPYTQIYTVEKLIPTNTINEDEVFEVCIEYSNGRTCELLKNDMDDNSEYVVFDLNNIT